MTVWVCVSPKEPTRNVYDLRAFPNLVRIFFQPHPWGLPGTITVCAQDRWKAWQLGYHHFSNPSWPVYMAFLSCEGNPLFLFCFLLKEVRSVYRVGTKRFGWMPIKWHHVRQNSLPIVNTCCPGIIPAHSPNLKVPWLFCSPVVRENFSEGRTNNFLIRFSLA